MQLSKDFLAGQHRLHHKPPEVQKSQLLGFWSARGIRTAITLEQHP